MYLQESSAKKIKATIYLDKGPHFFFTCSGDESAQTSHKEFSGIIDYCSKYDLYRYSYSANDNFDVTIAPLECSLGATLGLSADATFLLSCVDFSKGDSKPLVYVNNVYSYFNVTGKMNITNIKFTGINALATPSNKMDDLSVYPQLYCSQSSPPSSQLTHLSPTVVSSCLITTLNSTTIKCVDPMSGYLTKPPTPSDSQKCTTQFNTTKSSTLSCSGELYSSDFFTLSSQNLYGKRRRTLFNIYAFAEHTTIRNSTPELVIQGCDFEYFLGQSYESLITIETNSLAQTTTSLKQVLTNDGSYTESQIFYIYNGADRGARINISDSSFAYSRFCKGMIVYRPTFFTTSSSLLNYTNLYMTNPIKNTSDAFIILQNSSFTMMNVYSTVRALALTGILAQTSSLQNGAQQDQVNVPQFVNKGIVINVEDFGGPIEVVDCTFSQNAHYIPSIYYNSTNQASYTLDQFTDSITTNELQLKICDTSSNTYAFFFGQCQTMTQLAGTDLDSLFDSYERLGLIYISRNKAMVLIKESTFTSNVGTFGGAITINSPNWKSGYQPHVVIYNNLFQGNMAYFSGNAIYIRNTLAKASLDSSLNCGGVNLIGNTFLNNFGMKVHNGGAVSAYCYYITSTTHQDYAALSQYTQSLPKQVSAVQYTLNSSPQTIVIQSLTDGSQLQINKMVFNVQNNQFDENFSGGKGTALYVRQMSYVIISQCGFQGNSPVYAGLEYQYSPYTRYYSGRSMNFYDSNCIDELDYLQSCKNTIDTSSFGGVQWPIVQGAVNIIFCQDDTCINNNATQILLITASQFVKNLAGPVLDTSITTTASQIFVAGGTQVTISQSTFTDNQGSLDLFTNGATSKLAQYFPSNYLSYSMSPLINIVMNPPSKVNFVTTMSFSIKQCQFLRNRNIQVQGLGTNQIYKGSLIQMQNLATQEPLYQQTLSLMISGSTFKDNQFTGTSSSLIYTYKILTKVESNTFSNNGRITTSVTSKLRSDYRSYVSSSQFGFKSYTFKDLQAYGCITLEGDTSLGSPHQMMYNTFSYIFAGQGAAYSLITMDSQEVYTYGNTYKFLFASTEGALVYWQQNQVQASLMMQNEQASYIYSMGNGAIRVQPIGSQTSNLIIQSSSFDNMNAQYGQAISLTQVGKVLVQNVNFTRSPLPASSNNQINNYFLSQYQGQSLALEGDLISSDLYSYFISDTLVSQEGFMDLQSIKNTVDTPLSFNGQVYQNSPYPYSQYAEFINCNFLGNKVTNYAGIYSYQSYVRVANQLSTVNKKVVNPYFIANNLLSASGVFGFEGGTIFAFENLQFINNTATIKGSTISLSQSSGTISSSMFQGNKAYQSGNILIQEGCTVKFITCNFIKNWAKDSSTLFAQNNPDTMISFVNSRFVNNTSGTNLINLLYSNANFTNTSFTDNIADSVNHGITLINSQATLSKVSITYTDQNFLWNNSYTVDTGFFNLNYQSSMNISNSTIENCRGAMASVLYLTGSSQARIGNNTVIKNSYSETGDAIMATLALQLIVDKTTFMGNSQTDIQLQQTPANITNSHFHNTSYNSLYVTGSSINLINNTFTYPRTQLDYSASQGKALYCQCLDTTRIINNTFTGLSAVQGGALYLLTSSRTANQKFLLSQNRFINNSAQQGGAVYLSDAVELDMIGNIYQNNFAVSVSENNYAATLGSKGQGGAFFYACDINGPVNASLQSYKNTCIVNIDANNKFLSNRADDGGAILWTKFRPNIDPSAQFSNNSAYYGPNIGSFPGGIKMQFISNNDYVDSFNSSGAIPNTTLRRTLQENNSSSVGNVPSLVSGNTIDFDLYVLDQDGNVYRTDNSSKAVVGSGNSTGVILLNNQIIATNGVYNFRNVTLITQPGTDAPLQFTISGLNAFGNSIGFINSPVNFTASVRGCVSGEQQTSDGQCKVCPPGTFQYFTPNSTTPCQTCPPEATCFGLATVAPLPGYWRSSNTTSNFVACPNPLACLGGDAENPNGKCAEGYQGIVCGDCINNYFKTKQFTCGQCPEQKSNLIQTILILFGVVFYLAFLVRSTLASADKQKPVHAVYLKIMTNHIQILGAISNINYSWPQVIKDYEDKQEKVTSASNSVFSFDCFIMSSGGSTQNVPIFFQKLIMFGFLPAILFAACLLFWGVVGKIQKKSLAEFRGKFISTLIIVLFLVHPNIAQAMFLTFNCIEIDGVFRMKENIETICYKGQHMFFISIIAFPAIGLWVIGIPLFALLMLLMNKRVINLMSKKEITMAEQEEINQVKVKYGFLFQGYDSRTFFWEIIIMYRKILIIMTSVFLSTVSPESQVLVVIFIIVVNMFMQIRFNPFYTSTLNHMENYSLQVAALTVYTGMYYVTGSHYTYMENQVLSWFLLMCIMLPNGVFVLYWAYNMRLEVLKEAYRMKVNPIIFKILACQSPENFYESQMRLEEEKAKESKQIIIDAPQSELKDGENGSGDNGKFESSIESKKRGINDEGDYSSYNDKSAHTLDELRLDATSPTPRDIPNDRKRLKKRDSRGLKRAQNFDDGPAEITKSKWDAAPSTSRSYKIHPESAMTTSRKNNYVDSSAKLEDVDLKYESQIEETSFKLKNDKMLSKIASIAASKRNKKEGRHVVDSYLSDGVSKDSRKRRYNETEESKDRTKGKNGQRNNYLVEEVEIDDIDMTLEENFDSKMIKLKNGKFMQTQGKDLESMKGGTFGDGNFLSNTLKHESNHRNDSLSPSRLGEGQLTERVRGSRLESADEGRTASLGDTIMTFNKIQSRRDRSQSPIDDDDDDQHHRQAEKSKERKKSKKTSPIKRDRR